MLIRNLILSFLVFAFACKSTTPEGSYRAVIKRKDGLNPSFLINEKNENGKRLWVITNADEELVIDDITEKGDSLLINMPFFDAQLNLIKTAKGYTGEWTKATSKGVQIMPIELIKSTQRLDWKAQPPLHSLTGTWETVFVNKDGKQSNAIGEFTQDGNKLKGTFLTTTGDYRFLEGEVSGDSLILTTFDGTHAFYFVAKINAKGDELLGTFASGPTSIQSWVSKKTNQVSLDGSNVEMKIKGAENSLNFKFLNLDSQWVSIEDDRFKNKVVVIQIMGSWCPNCMDETAYLSQFYAKNKEKGVEMLALAYEYSEDFSRSRQNLSRFQKRFNVEYPILITGVTSSDSLKTEKTLPQFTPIVAFPSMIVLGKDGTVRKTHAGYDGPATGVHHEKFKKEFESMIESLLNED